MQVRLNHNGHRWLLCNVYFGELRLSACSVSIKQDGTSVDMCYRSDDNDYTMHFDLSTEIAGIDIPRNDSWSYQLNYLGHNPIEES